ncbi:NADH dehydrogenase [ubiquinone] flavoprotein 3, mitochondrial [Spea bombifrons]|uniref:NADH dehydrogenase [ubiquinone] flavoprotein 3, mitochondrial n=1 Tax=Spea bombifrons TaxID=233779 RepID=UPI00234A8536|nr:NADH dehydrogenase [ubiquinone] flavoprotein 3, mitochondrial [Spea bombifrons]
MAAPVLRALRGLQVVRWQLMSTRPFQSQRASQARDGKTLVSFPAKVSFPARVSDGSKDSVKAAPETPAADQPFDNSRYQNLQHHSYDPFTFVDYDVELARFRLPQPSAGRPSPRH